MESDENGMTYLCKVMIIICMELNKNGLWEMSHFNLQLQNSVTKHNQYCESK